MTREGFCRAFSADRSPAGRALHQSTRGSAGATSVTEQTDSRMAGALRSSDTRCMAAPEVLSDGDLMRAGLDACGNTRDIRTLLDRSTSLCSKSMALKIDIAILDTHLQRLIRDSTDLIQALRFERVVRDSARS